MNKTRFHIERMDCSSEEQMVRMRLEDASEVDTLVFDLGERQLDVYHSGSSEPILEALVDLELGAHLLDRVEGVDAPVSNPDASDRAPLAWALAINFTLFVAELVAGLVAGSMGLLADSLDMLADALVYTLSLVAIGGSNVRKRRLAASSGYLQLALAVFGLGEVVRRFVAPSGTPDVWPMVIVSLFALAANLVTLRILRRTKRGEAHIEASWIFTSNDIKVNLLVVGAGLLVWWSSSQVPDLLAGGIIFLIVASGARRILALAGTTTRKEEAQ